MASATDIRKGNVLNRAGQIDADRVSVMEGDLRRAVLDDELHLLRHLVLGEVVLLVVLLVHEYERIAVLVEVLAGSLVQERAGLEEYRLLKKTAEAAGQWPAARERALRFLRAEALRMKADHSPIVSILLSERNAAAAWEEASKHGCNSRLWLQLAEWREKKNPLEALAVYRTLLKPVLARPQYSAYTEAVELLKRMHACHGRLEQLDEFASYLAELRMSYKRRRHFALTIGCSQSGSTVC